MKDYWRADVDGMEKEVNYALLDFNPWPKLHLLERELCPLIHGTP